MAEDERNEKEQKQNKLLEERVLRSGVKLIESEREVSVWDKDGTLLAVVDRSEKC